MEEAAWSQPFDGYQMYPQRTLTSNVSMCGDNVGHFSWPGSPTDMIGLEKQMCDSSPQCDIFTVNMNASHAGGGFKRLVADARFDVYISTTKCGTFPNGSLVPSSSVESSCIDTDRNLSYHVCTGIGDFTALLVTFELPPFEIKKACDLNPNCGAFEVNRLGTMGKLYQGSYNPSFPDDVIYLKVFANQSRSADVRGNADPPTKVFDGYHQMPAVDLRNLTNTSVYRPMCNGYPWEPSIMGVGDRYPGALGSICHRNRSLCDTFLDNPVPDPSMSPTVATWFVWKYRSDLSVDSFVSTSACYPSPSSCNDSPPVLLCYGLDTTSPLQIETYDLPRHMIAEACSIKRCHAFVVKRDNSSGALLRFADSLGRKSSYLAV